MQNLYHQWIRDLGGIKSFEGSSTKGIDYNHRRWWSKVGMHEVEVMGGMQLQFLTRSQVQLWR